MDSYDYYDPGFGFCKPSEPLQKQSESLGAAFMGDRLYNSPFDVSAPLSKYCSSLMLTDATWQIRMKQNVTCSKLCTTTMSGDAASFIDERIRESYSINWLVDGLPAADAAWTVPAPPWCTITLQCGKTAWCGAAATYSTWRLGATPH